MSKLLARLEKRFGKYAIEHLTFVIVGGMAGFFVLATLQPRFLTLVNLDLNQVAHGQVWRLFTYLFIPRTLSIFWIVFSLMWLWTIGTSLEAEWGAFKFNLYYLLGMLGTTIAAAIAGGGVGNEWLNASLILAFGTLFPNFEMLIFFFPLRVKWLAILTGGVMAYEAFVGDWYTRAAIISSLSNYFLFFGNDIRRLLRHRGAASHKLMRSASSEPLRPPTEARMCAICGATDIGGADIRVCTCPKCAGPRQLCLEHARNH